MNLHPVAIGFSLLSMFSVLGCEQGDIASDDPLAGTWSNDACFGSSTMPEDVESCSTEITLANDLDVELKAEQLSLAATAMNPGCTTTRRITGQKWSTNHETDTLTITGRGNATIERSGCVKAEDNLEAEPTSDIALRPGDMRYELDGDTLSVLSGSLSGTYTR